MPFDSRPSQADVLAIETLRKTHHSRFKQSHSSRNTTTGCIGFRMAIGPDFAPSLVYNIITATTSVARAEAAVIAVDRFAGRGHYSRRRFGSGFIRTHSTSASASIVRVDSRDPAPWLCLWGVFGGSFGWQRTPKASRYYFVFGFSGIVCAVNPHLKPS
jgi:hypothetical protein